jgi:DNA-binding transcriptional ArsR family regulator
MAGVEPDARWETLARMVRHPLRAQALFRYAQGVTSPSEIATALGARLNLVSHHTKVLLQAGAIELVHTVRKRGATEHFYRALLPVAIEDPEWAELPLKLRRALTRAVIDGAMREAADALADGGMDGEITHLSRTYLALDDQGERELAALLRDTFSRAQHIELMSRERVADAATRQELVIMSFQRGSSP